MSYKGFFNLFKSKTKPKRSVQNVALELGELGKKTLSNIKLNKANQALLNEIPNEDLELEREIQEMKSPRVRSPRGRAHSANAASQAFPSQFNRPLNIGPKTRVLRRALSTNARINQTLNAPTRRKPLAAKSKSRNRRYPHVKVRGVRTYTPEYLNRYECEKKTRTYAPERKHLRDRASAGNRPDIPCRKLSNAPRKTPPPLPPSPRQPSPRQSSPRQPSPRQSSPRQPSPRQLSPRQLSPRQPSPRQSSPRQPSSQPPILTKTDNLRERARLQLAIENYKKAKAKGPYLNEHEDLLVAHILYLSNR